MKYFTATVTAFLGIILLTPLTTHASITGHAYRFGDDQALYMIEFSFATQQNDYYIPIRATQSPDTLPAATSYSILSEMTGSSTAADTVSLIISEQPVVDDHYFIPAGETGDFTLLIFADINDPNPLSAYRAQVNALPHLVGTDRTSTDVSDQARSFLTTPTVQFPLVLGSSK